MLGISRSLHRDLRSRAIDFTNIFRRKFGCGCSDVLFEPRQLRCARDWHYPWLLSEQPRERDLSRCRLLPFRDHAKQINHDLISFAGLGREARNDVAKVGTVEGGVFVDLSGEKAFPEGTERNQADSQLLECRNYLPFRLPPPERVF